MATASMPKLIITRAPQTDAELHQFVATVWGVHIPWQRVCAQHQTPFEAFADAYFARSPMSIWKSSRGFGGKSFLLATLGMTEMVTLKARVNILGASGQQSKRVHEAMQHMWNAPYAPRNLLARDPTLYETNLTTGARCIALTASQGSVRGPHEPRLRLDEIDEMDITILDAALGQPMQQGDIRPQVVMSSTHQYADGTMAEMYRRANERQWATFEWCMDGNSVIIGVDRSIYMKDIRVGDAIYAWKDGRIIPTTVTDAWQSGVRETCRVITSSGTLTCTPEHKVLSPQGWTCAGFLRPGDLVCAVSTSQTVLQGSWALPRVPLRETMPRVWQEDQSPQYAMSCLCKQDEKSSHQDPLCVWPAQASPFTVLPDVLSPHDDEAQYARGGGIGPGTRARGTDRQQPQKNQSSRTSCRAIIAKTPDTFSQTSAAWSICDRLLFARDALGYRGAWGLLAYSSCPTRPRQAEGASSQEIWVSSPDTARSRETSMDIAVVESVEPGPTIPVYDLTVADGNSFIANNIIVHNCYRETLHPHGWLPQTEVDLKRTLLTDVMWRIEIEGQEPSGGFRAILPEAVEAAFDPALGIYAGQNGEALTFAPPLSSPTLHSPFATGTDWAKEQDWTIVVTFNTADIPWRAVAWERLGRLSWPRMVGALDARVERYGGRSAHDNTGLGDVIDDYLTEPSIGVQLVGRARQDIFSDYIAAIEGGKIRYPRIQWAYDEHRYVTQEHLYGSGHPPDSFVAGALAWHTKKLAPARAGAWGR